MFLIVHAISLFCAAGGWAKQEVIATFTIFSYLCNVHAKNGLKCNAHYYNSILYFNSV